MATAQETIVTALQALKVLGLGESPTTAQNVYCLKQLNAYLRQLRSFGVSLAMINRRVDSSYQVGLQWPALRLECTTGVTITLPEGAGQPVPDGMRIEVIDVAGTAASSPITIARNGWKINGAAANYTISANGGAANLFFRAELGDWRLLADLALADDLGLPAEFDEAIALNAARRFTLFGQRLSPEDFELAEHGEARLRARYGKAPPATFDPALWPGGDSATGYYGSLADFLAGRY